MKNTALPYCIDLENGIKFWFASDAVIDELPTAEPVKPVLTKEQAKIVDEAHYSNYPATYISDRTDVYYENNEELLMSAYVNGYTVEKEKKYNVKVPHSEGWHFQKYSSTSKLGSRNNWKPFPAKDSDSNMSKELFQFTESEIEQYGMQDCEKEEVTDDDEEN